jgi:hypothetical protein
VKINEETLPTPLRENLMVGYRDDRRLTRGNTEGDTLALSIKHSMDFRNFGSNIVTQGLNTTVPTPNHGWVNTY